VPCIRPVHSFLYRARLTFIGVVAHFARAVWWTPLFLSRIETAAPGLRLEGGMPVILGPLRVRLGRDCRVSGAATWSGRPSSNPAPVLDVGSNCDLGWMCTLASGTRIVLGNNVRLAGQVSLLGYPGHPLDPAARAEGLPCLDEQSGDILLDDDVWLGTGVKVLAGVRIGRGTVVGAGSTVTHDLPPMCLAAGTPCRVIRPLVTGDQP
jgi:acetyltransferase-like isoleucine patch superfamily enzyme